MLMIVARKRNSTISALLLIMRAVPKPLSTLPASTVMLTVSQRPNTLRCSRTEAKQMTVILVVLFMPCLSQTHARCLQPDTRTCMSIHTMETKETNPQTKSSALQRAGCQPCACSLIHVHACLYITRAYTHARDIHMPFVLCSFNGLIIYTCLSQASP